MRVVCCTAPNALALEDRPTTVAGAGEVLVRIRRVGLCGTDYHIVAGRQPYLSYPRVMGHELAGEVAQAPAGSALRPGERVTINPYLACGTCIACRKGKPNCCVAISVLGVHADGGMCEYLSVPERAVLPVGALSLDEAAMVEFLAVGAHAVRRGASAEGDRVLVMGAGPIGIAVALFARLRGAEVTLADVDGERLARAGAVIGLDRLAIVDDAIAERLRDATGGEFFDGVYDATGNYRAMEAGFAYVAHGGTYVLVSVVKQDIGFSDPEFHKREMTLLGSRNALDADFRMVIDAIQRGDIPTAALVTHRLALDEVPATMPRLMTAPGSVLKALVTV